MSFDLSILGVKRNIPKVDFRDYSGLIQAPAKWGKTTFISKLPKTILVAFESGYDASVIDYVDCSGKDGWQKFIKFIDSLEKNRDVIGNDIKIIGIDTAEESYAACEKYMLKKESINDGQKYSRIGDIPHGGGYVRKDDYYREQIKRLYALGFKPVYLTHTEIKTVRPKDKNQEAYDIYVPTIPDRLRKIIFPEVSYIINGTREVIDGKRTRMLQLQGTEDCEVGSRLYIDENIVFETEQEAIEKLEEVFRKTIEKKLREAGINDDIDDLAAQQDKERLDEVARNYTETSDNEVMTNAEFKEKIKELTANGVTKRQIMTVIEDAGYDSPSDVDDPTVMVEILNNLQ